MSSTCGGDRVLNPSVDIVIEMIRIIVAEQYPALMPSLYPGELPTADTLYVDVEAMWSVFTTLGQNATPATNGGSYPALIQLATAVTKALAPTTAATTHSAHTTHTNHRTRLSGAHPQKWVTTD